MAFPSNWSRKAKIAIDADKLDSDLSGFPLVLTAANLPDQMLDADGSHAAQGDASDLRFSMNADGSNPIPAEVVTFEPKNDPGNAAAEVWVKPDTLSSSSDTEIYAWWGNAGASAPTAGDSIGRNAVWDHDYNGVWHLQSGSTASGSFTDASGTGNHGTGGDGDADKAPSDAASGAIGGAQDFDGSDDRIQIPDDSTLDPGGPLTLSFWFYKTGDSDNNAYPRPVSKGQSTSSDGAYGVYLNDNNNEDVGFRYITTSNTDKTVSTTVSSDYDGAWHHLAVSFDPDTDEESKIFYDGNLIKTASIPDEQIRDTGYALQIGNGNSQRPFHGRIDQVSLSAAERSADWLAARFANEDDPGSFTSGVDVKPYVANPVSSLTLDDDTTDSSIDLANVFADVEDSDSSLTFSQTNVTNGSLIDTVSADNGNDTLEIDTALNANGTTDITVAAGDSGGLTATHTFTLTVNDTTAPSIDVDSVASDDAINAAETTGGITITGSNDAEANGEDVAVDIGGISKTATASSGTWSVSLTQSEAQGLTEGSRTVDAEVGDGHGNTGTASRSITVDRTAPTADFKHQTATPTKADTVVFDVDFGEEIDTSTLGADDFVVDTSSFSGSVGTLTTDDAGDADPKTWDVTIPNVDGDGELGIDFASPNIKDPAGNAVNGAPGVEQTVTVDQSGPVATFQRATTSPTNASAVDFDVTFDEPVAPSSIQAADFAADTAGYSGTVGSLTLGNASDADNATWHVSLTGLNGEGDLGLDFDSSADIADDLGNTITAPPTADPVIVRDTTPPGGLDANARTTADARPKLTGTVSDTSASVSITVDGTTRTATNNGDGTWTLADDALPSLSPGSYAIGVSATDPAGNTASTTVNNALTITDPTPTPAPPPPPPPQPEPPASDNGVDGVDVDRGERETASGVVLRTTRIPVVGSAREEDPDTPNESLADIPLRPDGTAPVRVSLPVGTGATASVTQAAQTPDAARTRLTATITDMIPESGGQRSDALTEGTRFLDGLESGSDVHVARVSLDRDAALADPDQPIRINGLSGPSGENAEIVVLDAQALPAGTTIRTDDVDMMVVRGAARLRDGRGPAVIVGDESDNDVFNGPGDDVQVGGAGADNLASGKGDDRIAGGGGADVLAGGAGADILSGGAGDDRLDGESGDDDLVGGAGADAMFGHDGADVLDGGAGRDTLTGGRGADTLLGGPGDDRLVANAGDTAIGSTDADTLEMPALDGVVTLRDPTPGDTLRLPDRQLTPDQVRVETVTRGGEATAALRLDTDGDGSFDDAPGDDAPGVVLSRLADAEVAVESTAAGGTAIRVTGSDMLFDELSVQDRIAALYLGFLDRAPDPGGLDYWVSEYEAGVAEGRTPRAVLNDISESIRLSDEAGRLEVTAALRPAAAPVPSEVATFVDELYQRFFGRDPDPAGKAYWTETITERLAEGRNMGDTAVDIAAGALTTERTNDAAVLRNRMELGQDVAASIDTGGDGPATTPTPAELRLPFESVDATYTSFAETRAGVEIVGTDGREAADPLSDTGS